MWVSRKYFNFLKHKAEQNIDAECQILTARENQKQEVARAMEEYSAVLKERDDLRLRVAELEHKKAKAESEHAKVVTNADKIHSMTSEELADFFFESPEIEFEVCEYCKNFGGHMSDTPCKHDMGLCYIADKNEAFKKWLQQPYKN